MESYVERARTSYICRQQWNRNKPNLHEHHPLAARLLPALGRTAAVHEGVHISVAVRLGQDRVRVIRVQREGSGRVLKRYRGGGRGGVKCTMSR